MYLNDTKCRQSFAKEMTALIIIRIIEMNPGVSILDLDVHCRPALILIDISIHQEDALYNAVSVIYSMAKMSSCRLFLSSSPVNADAHLIKLSQHDNPRLKSNIARTIKNLVSDANEAIEEGAVAALIAMSLEVSSCIFRNNTYL